MGRLGAGVADDHADADGLAHQESVLGQFYGSGELLRAAGVSRCGERDERQRSNQAPVLSHSVALDRVLCDKYCPTIKKPRRPNELSAPRSPADRKPVLYTTRNIPASP